MKKTHSIFSLFVAATILILFSSACNRNKTSAESFSFVFMTDIHLTTERNAVEGFTKAIRSVNELNPDFVITGGDLIMDALGQRYSRADSLYNLYINTVKEFKMVVHNTLGNHELYGLYPGSGADQSNPEFGEKMYEKRIGDSYYSFEHKGWKFIILNSIEDTGKESYIGRIDEAQITWIKTELEKTDKSVPIVISTHIPFITANTQKYEGTTIANDSSTVISNGKEVLDLFHHHNLKLVLQGHLHTVEDISIDGIHFVTGGAVSAGWWQGPNREYQEGYVLVTTAGKDFTWRYVDYGWEVKK